MLDTDGYLKLAASNFQRAETHLADTETHLRKLLERLENCSRLFGDVSKEKSPLWEQIDALVSDSQPVSS